jgi:hypothetical protein
MIGAIKNVLRGGKLRSQSHRVIVHISRENKELFITDFPSKDVLASQRKKARFSAVDESLGKEIVSFFNINLEEFKVAVLKKTEPP